MRRCDKATGRGGERATKRRCEGAIFFSFFKSQNFSLVNLSCFYFARDQESESITFARSHSLPLALSSSRPVSRSPGHLQLPVQIKLFQLIGYGCKESSSERTIYNPVIIRHGKIHHVADSDRIALFGFYHYRSFFYGAYR